MLSQRKLFLIIASLGALTGATPAHSSCRELMLPPENDPNAISKIGEHVILMNAGFNPRSEVIPAEHFFDYRLNTDNIGDYSSIRFVVPSNPGMTDASTGQSLMLGSNARGITQDRGGFELSTQGSTRYFWFTTLENNKQVAARVLDIHHFDLRGGGFTPKNGFVILIETIEPIKSSNGLRTRVVKEIKLEELATATRGPHLTSERAQFEFRSDLSLQELSFKNYASERRLPLYAYTDIFRSIGSGAASANIPPFSSMNSLVLLAITATLREHFDLTGIKDEISFFGSMPPDRVLREYGRPNFQYSWVITEDGRLKILPKMPFPNNLKPQLLRLAVGRKIFAGGDFTIEADGSLNMVKDGNGYQDLYAGGDFFNQQVDDLDAFIQKVFREAAFAEVRTSRANRMGGIRSNGTRNSAQTGSGLNFGRQAEQAPVLVSWDPETGRALDFESWSKLSGSGDRLSWAHYVLGTHPSLNLTGIKKRYRTLALRFHPDRSSGGPHSKQFEWNMKMCSSAYREIERLYLK